MLAQQQTQMSRLRARSPSDLFADANDAEPSFLPVVPPMRVPSLVDDEAGDEDADPDEPDLA
eukprot:15436013-Alexandrium_andersonii.AAC.1